MASEKPIPEQILVVDDDRAIRQLLGDALEREGYTPLICGNPDQALAVSGKTAFGLAFVDINLPHMNGLDLARELKKQDPRREVVFITGHGTFDSAVKAIKIGAYDYLRKPFSLNDFNLCIKRYQERQALKEQVRLAEQRYSHLVQHIPLIIYVLNREFVVDFINDACTQALGFTPEEAVNTPGWFLERIHPEDRDRIRRLFESAFESDGDPFSTECRLLHKEGHRVHALLRSMPHLDENPDTDHLEGIMVDITDRVFLEKALAQREKLKTLGSISAEVAHEIRNPLVALGGFARRLKKKHPDLHEVDIILNESERLEKILGRIRHYLKPVELRPEPCGINELTSYCVELLSPALEQKRIQPRLDLNPGLPDITADRDVLTQVFINLVRHAIKATKKGGRFHIKTFESDRNIHVEFGNQVAKKRAEDPEQLFLPFDEGGHHIGLPLSYKFVRNMGGLLSFEQRKDLMIFTVSLPKEPLEIRP
jgi:PAS domain S-box-containing protein